SSRVLFQAPQRDGVALIGPGVIPGPIRRRLSAKCQGLVEETQEDGGGQQPESATSAHVLMRPSAAPNDPTRMPGPRRAGEHRRPGMRLRQVQLLVRRTPLQDCYLRADTSHL